MITISDLSQLGLLPNANLQAGMVIKVDTPASGLGIVARWPVGRIGYVAIDPNYGPIVNSWAAESYPQVTFPVFGECEFRLKLNSLPVTYRAAAQFDSFAGFLALASNGAFLLVTLPGIGGQTTILQVSCVGWHVSEVQDFDRMQFVGSWAIEARQKDSSDEWFTVIAHSVPAAG